MRIFKALHDILANLEGIEDAINEKNISAIESQAEQTKQIVETLCAVKESLDANQDTTNNFLLATTDLLERVGSLVGMEIEERTKEASKDPRVITEHDKVF